MIPVIRIDATLLDPRTCPVHARTAGSGVEGRCGRATSLP